MGFATDLLRAGCKPWLFFLVTLSLWALGAWLFVCTPTDVALSLGVFGWLLFLFVAAFFSERFWNRYLELAFIDENLWLRSWLVIGCSPVLLGLAFRFGIHTMETAAPGLPVVALLEPGRLLYHFFLGSWGWGMFAFRLLCIAALFAAAWGWHLNTLSRRNLRLARLSHLISESAADDIRRDTEKKRFGRHRNLFEDN